MKAKTARNKRILAAYLNGATIADLARKHGLKWPRTQRIIKEQQAREMK